MGKAKEQRAEYNTGTEQGHEIRHKNPIKELGFAAMEHALTLDTDLSDGAYRTYALLKFYWQHKSEAFPTVDTMAEKRGIRRETIGVHLKELVQKGLITRKARVGTSTMTYLEDLPQEYVDLALAELERRDARREENLTAGRSPLGKSNPRREENLTQSTTIKEKQQKAESPKANFYECYHQAFGEMAEAPTPRNELAVEEIEMFPRQWIDEALCRTARAERGKGEIWRQYQRVPYALRLMNEWKRVGNILPERSSQPRQARPAVPVTGKSWDQMEIYD
jgi:DNA-binding MarR family transcriptional regulator